jgi:hypothetical protein
MFIILQLGNSAGSSKVPRFPLPALNRGYDLNACSLPTASAIHLVHHPALRGESAGQVPRTGLPGLLLVQRPHRLRPLLHPPCLQRTHQLF